MLLNVAVLGDSHGNFHHLKYLLRPNTIHFHVGDFGIGFGRDKNDLINLQLISKRLKELGSKLFVIRGNHDNPAWFNGTWYGDSIQLVEDYTQVEVNGVTYFLVGGAISIDRHRRKEGLDYWAKEVFVLDESKVIKSDNLIIHAAPLGVFPYNHTTFLAGLAEPFRSRLYIECLEERKKIARLVELVEPKKCYYGHYHTHSLEVIEGIEYRCIPDGERYDVI